MASPTLFVVASALMVQAVFGQYVGSGSYVTGNSVVENDIYIGNSAVNLGRGGLNLGSGLNVGSGLNLGSGLNIGSGLNLGSGLNIGNGLNLVNGLNNVGLIGGGIGSNVGVVGLSDLNVVSSGPLVVTTISPIGPSGVAVASENVIEGNLLVSGTLPFLSAVAFEGALPSAGSGVATCGCGSGSVGIISEGFPQPLAANGLGLGLGLGVGGFGVGGLGVGGLNVGGLGLGLGNRYY